MLKRSTALEYKLHRAVQSKDDFITYIQVCIIKKLIDLFFESQK